MWARTFFFYPVVIVNECKYIKEANKVKIIINSFTAEFICDGDQDIGTLFVPKFVSISSGSLFFKYR